MVIEMGMVRTVRGALMRLDGTIETTTYSVVRDTCRGFRMWLAAAPRSIPRSRDDLVALSRLAARHWGRLVWDYVVSHHATGLVRLTRATILLETLGVPRYRTIQALHRATR